MRLKHGLPLMKKFGSHLRNSLVWLRVSTSFKTKKVVRFQRICLQAHNFRVDKEQVWVSAVAQYILNLCG